jgi:hypothetical protein
VSAPIPGTATPRVPTIDDVLLNRATAKGIAEGSITLVLRRRDVPRAKVGRRQRTPVG